MQTTDRLTPLSYIPQNIYCAQDYESMARQFIPADRYAYIAGGSRHDITVRSNRKAFDSYTITPRVLRNAATAKLCAQIGGQELSLPFMLAPLAHQKLVNTDAEIASSQAAEAMQTGYVACTLSSYSMEEISQQLHTTPKWFQLYKQATPEATKRLIDRAIAAGYQAILLTLDTNLQAPSFATLDSGFTWPKTLIPANLKNLPQANQQAPADIFDQFTANSFDAEFIASLVDQCPIPVYAKGILSKEDAVALKALGCRGIVVSNHGGRSFDGAPSSLSVLPEIRATLGEEYPILLDSGIRSGSDIFKAIALGANAVMIGRLQVYALSVAGSLGVAHMLKLLKEELEYTMAMTGCSNIEDIRNTRLRPSEHR